MTTMIQFEIDTEVTEDMFLDLPVGTKISSHRNAEVEFWQKQDDNHWYFQGRTEEDSVDNQWYTFGRGYKIVGLPETAHIQIEWDAIRAGMLIGSLGLTSGERDYGAVIYITNDQTTCDGRPGKSGHRVQADLSGTRGYEDGWSSPVASEVRWMLIPHPQWLTDQIAAGEFPLAGAEPAEPEAASYTQEQMDAAVERARLSAQATVETRWMQKMERLNSEAQEWADEHSMCEKYDEFARDHEEYGLTPRTRSYTVRFTITGEVTMNVNSARDADEAEELAREAMAIREDDEWSLNGESFTVTNVSHYDTEKDD